MEQKQKIECTSCDTKVIQLEQKQKIECTLWYKSNTLLENRMYIMWYKSNTLLEQKQKIECTSCDTKVIHYWNKNRK